MPSAPHVIEAGSGPALLMLHGLFDSSQTWAPLMPFLRGQFKLYAMDLPGFGQSPLPGDWGEGIESMTQVLLSFLERLPEEKISLLGSSMGGALALALALKVPDQISKIVLCNPYALPEEPLAVHNAKRPFVGRVLPYLLGEKVLCRCSRGIYARSLHKQALVDSALISRVIAPFSTLKQRRNLFRFLRSISLQAICAVDAELPSLKPEVLVLWGKEDQWLSAGHWQRLQARIPKVSVIQIPGCGHLPHYDDPEQIASHILSFMGREES